MTGLLRGKLRAVTLFAVIAALFAVFSVVTVDSAPFNSELEVASIDVADFSVDAPAVSIEQVAETDTLTPITAIHGRFDSTADYALPLSILTGADGPDIRLDGLTKNSTPRLDSHGDGGIL